MAEQTAIMRNVKFGLGDRGVVWLSFATYMDEGSAADQYIRDWDEIQQIFKDAKAADVKNLEGHPCVVNVDGSVCLFVRVWKKLADTI